MCLCLPVLETPAQGPGCFTQILGSAGSRILGEKAAISVLLGGASPSGPQALGELHAQPCAMVYAAKITPLLHFIIYFFSSRLPELGMPRSRCCTSCLQDQQGDAPSSWKTEIPMFPVFPSSISHLAGLCSSLVNIAAGEERGRAGFGVKPGLGKPWWRAPPPPPRRELGWTCGPEKPFPNLAWC